MASVNKVILAGNLTRDPELRYTPKGTAVAKVGLAINHKWTTDTGEKKEDVTFVDVDSFGRTAENLAQYVRKGSSILVEGRLKLDTWDDKTTGQKKSKLGVVAESIQFLSSPNRDAAPDSAPTQRAQKPSGPPVAGDEPRECDNLPF